MRPDVSSREPARVARTADAVSSAVDERLKLLTAMIASQQSLTIWVRYEDHAVTSSLVRQVHACLATRLDDFFPGQVSERHGDLVIGRCRVHVRAADGTRAPDMVITVEDP